MHVSSSTRTASSPSCVRWVARSASCATRSTSSRGIETAWTRSATCSSARDYVKSGAKVTDVEALVDSVVRVRPIEPVFEAHRSPRLEVHRVIAEQGLERAVPLPSPHASEDVFLFEDGSSKRMLADVLEQIFAWSPKAAKEASAVALRRPDQPHALGHVPTPLVRDFVAREEQSPKCNFEQLFSTPRVPASRSHAARACGG